MEEFLKMDIFFVVTTVVVLALAILAGVILYRVIRILKNVEKISKEVADGAADLRSDFDSVRASAREGLQKIFRKFKVK